MEKEGERFVLIFLLKAISFERGRKYSKKIWSKIELYGHEQWLCKCIVDAIKKVHCAAFSGALVLKKEETGEYYVLLKGFNKRLKSDKKALKTIKDLY